MHFVVCVTNFRQCHQCSVRVTSALCSVCQHPLTVAVTNSLQTLSLYMSGLCHDVDHRGYTNQYLLDSSSIMGAMYSTSTMEHHHFNHTINVLQVSSYVSKHSYCIANTVTSLFRSILPRLYMQGTIFTSPNISLGNVLCGCACM